MIRQTVIFLLVLILWHSSNAQFTMEAYLSNSVQAVEIQSIKEQQYFIDQHGFKSPILRELEFRMRVTHFGEGLDNYKLRFSPINPYERSANKAYRSALEEQMNVQLKLSLNEVLKGRYQLMIDHFYLSQQLQLLNEEIELYEQLFAITGKQPQQFSIKDVIQTDKSLLKADLRKQELLTEQQQLEFLIRQTFDYQGNIFWSLKDLVSVNDIQDWLNVHAVKSINDNLFIQNEEQKSIVAASELTIKQRESFSDIGYLQAEYRPNENNTIGQNMGLQIAVNIPVVNADKPDLERRRLGMLEDMQDFVEEKLSLNTSMNFTQIQLNSFLKQYEKVSDKLKFYDGYQLNPVANGSLDTVLELRGFQFELKALELRLYSDILEKYITMRAFDGDLAEDPYLNYLSADKNGFDLDL